MSEKRDIDTHSGVETTGHEWDGIKELNNPLPRWWVFVLWATILWAIAYWVFMPSWPAPPGMQGYTHGTRQHSDRANVAADLEALNVLRAAFAKRLAGAPLAQIESDPELQAFAIEAGRSAFANNCATCHGSGAQGAPGYPNLNDDDWLWGGTLTDIHTTISAGVRSISPATRRSQMPAFGRDKLLQPAQIDDLVHYVLEISGRPADRKAAERARPLFAEQCASCHGPDGKGSAAQGAPNLTDAIWLYGGDPKTLRETIWAARSGVMPTWGGRLDPMTIDALAVYVHALGGGQ